MGSRMGTALITGASRGLGRALALAMSREGWGVAICARTADALEETAGRIRAGGGECVTDAVDVTDATAVDAWVRRAADRLGQPRVLINNASVLGPRVSLAEHPVDEWRHTLDVNLHGTFIATRAVLPWMIEAGDGVVINVSSGAAIPPRDRWGAYAVSKAAVEALTLNLAHEMADTGVRANIVDPGRMRTPMRADAYPEEDPAEVKPASEATGVFLWLASDAARHVTGRRFTADHWRTEAGL